LLGEQHLPFQRKLTSPDSRCKQTLGRIWLLAHKPWRSGILGVEFFSPAPSMPCTAILVAAGSSRRMGFDKLAAPLAGTPVLARTLAAFMECEEISEIILVTPAERMLLLDETTFTKPVIRIEGGAERHLSVAAGLGAVSADAELIAIHDAARPYVSQADLLATIREAREHGAAALARRVTETLKRADASDFTAAAVPRDDLWFIETPQIFRAGLIHAAYKHILDHPSPVTDETSALEAIGVKTKLIPSTSPNPKITTPSDLIGAKFLV
jgi:2-C-methyl-D-erythritol 4-phosphate cytidylyltransferase